jgi:archaellum component FlaC
MRIANEEKQALIFDNQNISQQITEIQQEYEKMQRDMKDFMCFMPT